VGANRILCSTLALLAAAAGAAVAQEEARHRVLVELFTSQG